MNRHETDLISLVAGVAFIGIAGLRFVFRSISFDLPSFGWYVAGGLIAFGIVGIVSSLRPRDRRAVPPADRPSGG